VLQKLWYNRPVRTQLLIAVGAINLIAALLAGAVSILNTRTATRVEVEASLEIAQRFVAATMKDLAAKDRLEHLHVSYKTVANTCTQLKAKLGVRTLPELMRIAIQHLPSASAKAPRG
jgi:DNA-binding CsgD family transcriptional regulator